MKKFALLSLAVATVALSGCGNKNDASEDNFKTLLNATFKKVQYCLVDNDFGANFVDFSKGESIAYLGNDKSEEKILNSQPTMRNFQNAGLLRTKIFTKKQPGLFGGSFDQYNIGADLTDLGKQYFKVINGNSGFCGGNVEIVSITQFTPQAVDASGATVSQVDYAVHYANVPDVLQKLADAKPGLKTHLESNHVGHATMLLTNNGWTVRDWQFN